MNAASSSISIIPHPRLVAVLAVATAVLALLVPIGHASGQTGSVTFAMLGDYGNDSTAERDVENMLDGHPIEFIVTAGDNVYDNLTGQEAVGDYYGDYFAGGDTAHNRFFPSPGNHDYDDWGINNYLAYFDLPGAGVSSTNTSGSERYYDVIQGPVHFFFLDSDRAIASSSDRAAQQAWLQAQMSASTTPWQIVVLHHAPYSSARHGNNATMQWDYAAWGADAVLAGHDHTYERISRDGIVYFVNGLGGRSPYDFNAPIAGSEVRYNADHGAMVITADTAALSFEFRNRSNTVIDTHELNPLPADAHTVTFRQGVDGYNATTDTKLKESAPTTDHGAHATLEVDTYSAKHSLVRFGGLFASAGGPIPDDSTIVSATITLTSLDPGNDVGLHRMLKSWTESATWDSYGSGVQADNIEAATTADLQFSGTVGTINLDVTSTVADWGNNPAANFGWAMLPTGSNGVDLASSESAVVGDRPQLNVVYLDNTPPPTTDLAFRNGVNSYSGTQDTTLRSDAARKRHGDNPELLVDGSPTAHTLIRFDSLVGANPGQIPPGATIESATLELRSFDSGASPSVHRMLTGWSERTLWGRHLGRNGVQANGTEAAVTPDGTLDGTQTVATVDVTASVQAWTDGATNHGWALLPTGANGVDYRSSEYGTVAHRPVLHVTYSAN